MVHATPSSPSVQPAMPQGENATHRLGLFEYLNDICYFAKDRAHRFTAANRALVHLVSRRDQKEVLGKTDYELIAPYLADSYAKDDEHVMSSGEAITNKVELVTHNDLSVEWYTTTKIPLYDAAGTIVGLKDLPGNSKSRVPPPVPTPNFPGSSTMWNATMRPASPSPTSPNAPGIPCARSNASSKNVSI